MAAAIEAGCDAGWAYVGHVRPGDGELDLTLKPVLLRPQDDRGQVTESSGALQEDPSLCGWEDCTEHAVTALRFRGRPGHVHNCGPHASIHREWCDVIDSAPLPSCPFQHGGMWIDYPPDL